MKTVTLRTKLVSSTVRLKGVKQLLGKDVEVTVREVTKRKTHKKNWTYLGLISLGGKLDKVNLRDLVYE